jgi:hypothetical protein
LRCCLSFVVIADGAWSLQVAWSKESLGGFGWVPPNPPEANRARVKGSLGKPSPLECSKLFPGFRTKQLDNSVSGISGKFPEKYISTDQAA